MYREVFLVLCVFAGVQSKLNLDKIKLCSRYDNHCITEVADTFYNAAIRGDPDLKIENLDPIHLDYIHGKFVLTDYKLINTTLIGFQDCHVVNAKVALEQNKVDFEMSCPRVDVFGNYLVSGLLIIIPIEGNGDYAIETKDYHIFVETATKIREAKEGKRYLQFKNFKATGDLRGGMSIKLTNLFNGHNEELAQSALKFANDEWKPIAREFQGPTINANVRKIVKNLNKYLRKVPVDQFIQYY